MKEIDSFRAHLPPQQMVVGSQNYVLFSTGLWRKIDGKQDCKVTWAGVMCAWVTYPWTCWIWESCRSATWTSSAPRRSPRRQRDPSLISELSMSLPMSLSKVSLNPLSLLQVPWSIPSFLRVLASVSSLVTPIGCWWQVCWWNFGGPSDAPSSSGYRYF